MTHLEGGAGMDLIERRREAVARLRLRRLSTRAIAEQLPNLGIVNSSGEPYSQSTIASDLIVLRAQWHESAIESIAQRRAEELATLEEIYRAAFKAGDFELALKTHDRIAKLLGLNAPTSIGLGGIEGGEPIKTELLASAHVKQLVQMYGPDFIQLMEGQEQKQLEGGSDDE